MSLIHAFPIWYLPDFDVGSPPPSRSAIAITRALRRSEHRRLGHDHVLGAGGQQRREVVRRQRTDRVTLYPRQLGRLERPAVEVLARGRRLALVVLHVAPQV